MARLILDAADGERSPTRLMAGTDAAPVVTVEIFVEEHQVLEMRIVRVEIAIAVHGPATGFVREKNCREPALQFERNFAQREQAT
jgi:hypothetical protein